VTLSFAMFEAAYG